MRQSTNHQIDGEPLVVEYIKTGSFKLKEKVMTAYLPLVKYIIGRMNLPTNGILDKEDLYQFGMLGLMSALDRYDPANEASFKTFAYKRITGAVLDAVRKNNVLTREQMRKLQLVNATSKKLENELGRSPSPSEICKKSGVPEEEYYHILQLTQHNFEISIDEVRKDQNGDTSLVNETVRDEQQITPEDLFEKKQLKKELKSLIQNLPERPRLILALYFYEELTLFDIGQVLDISESRVSQIMNQTLVSIRKSLANNEMSMNAIG